MVLDDKTSMILMPMAPLKPETYSDLFDIHRFFMSSDLVRIRIFAHMIMVGQNEAE